jgi:hypothetical protein
MKKQILPMLMCGLAVASDLGEGGGNPLVSTAFAGNCWRTLVANCNATTCTATDWSCLSTYTTTPVTSPTKPWTHSGYPNGNAGSVSSGYCQWQGRYTDCWGTVETVSCSNSNDQGATTNNTPCGT